MPVTAHLIRFDWKKDQISKKWTEKEAAKLGEEFNRAIRDVVPKKRLKCLCVCLRGNVRSVALAYLIKLIYKHEAIAIGIAETTKETRQLLYQWADEIFVLDEQFYNQILHEMPNTDQKSIQLVHVGEDVWFNPYHHSLQHDLLKVIRKLEL